MRFVVKLIVYFEYISSYLLSYNLFNVTCDLFYPFDIDRYLLSVKINNEDMIIPEIAALKHIILPR
jgi:hypothetical protein